MIHITEKNSLTETCHSSIPLSCTLPPGLSYIHVMNQDRFGRDVSLGTNLVFDVKQGSPRDFEQTTFSQWHSSKGRNSPRTVLILM